MSMQKQASTTALSTADYLKGVKASVEARSGLALIRPISPREVTRLGGANHFSIVLGHLTREGLEPGPAQLATQDVILPFFGCINQKLKCGKSFKIIFHMRDGVTPGCTVQLH